MKLRFIAEAPVHRYKGNTVCSSAQARKLNVWWSHSHPWLGHRTEPEAPHIND